MKWHENIYFFPFYTPVWKTVILCHGNVRPSVCPQSFCPSFPDFFSRCFEISLWNLVYTFSGWLDMSNLSFIAFGSRWPTLQPKVGQTYFLQSWPNKSFKFGTYVAHCILLEISSVCLFFNIIFGILAIIFGVLDFSKFFGLFSTCFEILIWDLEYTSRRQ